MNKPFWCSPCETATSTRDSWFDWTTDGVKEMISHLLDFHQFDLSFALSTMRGLLDARGEPARSVQQGAAPPVADQLLTAQELNGRTIRAQCVSHRIQDKDPKRSMWGYGFRIVQNGHGPVDVYSHQANQYVVGDIYELTLIHAADQTISREFATPVRYLRPPENS